MELDLRTVKALASQTRIKLLRELRQEAATAEELGQRLGIEAEQVMMQLETLKAADLVDARSDQLGAAYTLTDKAEDIVHGRERSVQFSLSTATLSTVLGATVIGYPVLSRQQMMSATMESQQAAPDTTPSTPEAAETASWISGVDPVYLALGLVLLLFAAGLFFYGHRVRQLRAAN